MVSSQLRTTPAAFHCCCRPRCRALHWLSGCTGMGWSEAGWRPSPPSPTPGPSSSSSHPHRQQRSMHQPGSCSRGRCPLPPCALTWRRRPRQQLRWRPQQQPSRHPAGQRPEGLPQRPCSGSSGSRRWCIAPTRTAIACLMPWATMTIMRRGKRRKRRMACWGCPWASDCSGSSSSRRRRSRLDMGGTPAVVSRDRGRQRQVQGPPLPGREASTQT